jgi:hypothetical protein
MIVGAIEVQTHPVRLPKSTAAQRYWLLSFVLVALHCFFMLFHLGSLPVAPIVPDEIVINDASISLAQGHGLVAESLADSKYGLDHIFAHFPPLYPYTQALAFRILGISASSLRTTTTVMSIAASIVFVLLLYRLCVFDLMSWDVALLLVGLYCTNASFASVERMARMESMIGFLMLLSLGAIVWAVTLPPGKSLWPAMLAAGLFGALTVAVHPEAVTAVLMLATLLLFLVPARTSVRLASAALFILAPLAVGLVIYRSQIVTAAKQFLAIAHDSNAANRSSVQVFHDAFSTADVSALNRNLFLGSVMLLLAVAPCVYFWNRHRIARGTVQYRMAAIFAIVCILEILLMVFVLRMDSRRCQFLFGALLICNALSLWGSAPLRRWQSALGWLIVALQCTAAFYYVSARHDRVADMNPDRYMSVIDRLPKGASVATTPGLWLDLKEKGRPFTLILYGLDGEVQWSGAGFANPFRRFDIVIIEQYYSVGKDWLRDEARDGRTMYTYPVGSKVVEVYVKPNVHYIP